MAGVLGGLWQRLVRKPAPPAEAKAIEIAPFVVPEGSTVIVTAKVGGMTREWREKHLSMLRDALTKAKDNSPGTRFIVIPVVDESHFKIEAVLPQGVIL